MNVDGTFTTVNSNGGKFLEKDYYYEKEKGTLKKLSEKMAQKHIEENITNMLGLKGRLKYNINNKLAFDKMLACLERGYKYATYCSSYTV